MRTTISHEANFLRAWHHTPHLVPPLFIIIVTAPGNYMVKLYKKRK